MYDVKAIWIIIIGFVLVLLGALLPFLIMLHLIPSTFVLNIFSYAASVAGLFLGMIGTARYVGHRKRDQ